MKTANRARARSAASSVSSSDFSRCTCARDSSAEFTSNDGFSVVVDRSTWKIEQLGGALEPATRDSLRRALWTYPALTLGVVVRIHWHALRLWLKRVPFWRKPQLPEKAVTRQIAETQASPSSEPFTPTQKGAAQP